ncbi:MAG: glycosyltransferase [Gemmatimonadales bacterium]
MVKVTHIITSLSTGGAELSLLKLLEGSPDLRASARVISLRDLGTVGPRLSALGVPVTAIGVHGSIPTPAAMLRLRRLVRATHPVLLQGWMYHGNLAALAARAWLPRRVPLVWNIRHSVYSLTTEKPLTAMLIRLGAVLSRRPDRIIYNSRVAAAQHEALGYVADRTVIIPNGFDTDRFAPGEQHRAGVRAELGLTPETPLVGVVGRYHPMKDYANFLRAVALVRQECPTARFVMAGTDVTAANTDLMGLARDLGVGNIVFPIGEVTDTARLMAALDLLCLSSSSEGFPNVVGEAMSCGVPCVATDVGDAAWIVGDSGVVVPARNPVALAAGLTMLLRESTSTCAELGRKARRRIEEHFTLPAITRQYADLYAALTASTGPQ